MLPITDLRADCEKHLHEIEPSGFFIWGDEVYRRVESDMYVNIHYKNDGIPAIHQRSGDLTVIDRDAWVVPCRCELMITE